MSLRRKLAAVAIANLLAIPFMSGLVNAQVVTSQDRTVVTLDVTNSCTSVIDDNNVGGTYIGPRGDDQQLHDDDDSTNLVSLGDGFDEALPSPTTDYTDSDFSDETRISMNPSMTNIAVKDPDGNTALNGGEETDTLETDFSGYVDLEEFDFASNSYAAVFSDQITCDTSNGYDMHIADTFNTDPAFDGLLYDTYDIALMSPAKGNLNMREGMFRIAPDSLRDITSVTVGFETSEIKHEYIMDLPGTEFCPVFGGVVPNDDYTGDCAPASLNPFALSNGLRPWPYATPPLYTTYTAADDNDFGTVGFTLLCDANGGNGIPDPGAINPFTRGVVLPSFSTHVFRTGTGDCSSASDPIEYYGAIPSLDTPGSSDGIEGTDPSTYTALNALSNWVGYSGPSFANAANNFFEVRASLPNNQIAGTYATTIILSCLPNMTSEPELDFQGDGAGDDTTNP